MVPRPLFQPPKPPGPVLPDPRGHILCIRVANPNWLIQTGKGSWPVFGLVFGLVSAISALCRWENPVPAQPCLISQHRAPSSKPRFFPSSSANDSHSPAIPNILLQPGRLAGVMEPLLKSSNGFKRCILVFCFPHCVSGHSESQLKRVWANPLPVDLGRGCIPNFSMPPTPLLGCQDFKAIHCTITG